MTDIAPLKIAIGSDHAGPALKSVLVELLRGLGHEVEDLGPFDTARVDYPDYAGRVCARVVQGHAQFGILICGSGIGMSITANRHSGIRCALAGDVTSTRLSRQHNNANVLAMGARVIGEEVAADMVRVFLATAYEGGRHDLRLAKLDQALPQDGTNS